MKPQPKLNSVNEFPHNEVNNKISAIIAVPFIDLNWVMKFVRFL